MAGDFSIQFLSKIRSVAFVLCASFSDQVLHYIKLCHMNRVQGKKSDKKWCLRSWLSRVTRYKANKDRSLRGSISVKRGNFFPYE